ncbi:MAG: UDP-3-O-acyl-N-acetylglucosamine deacetylase [Oligoflexia bacterium]|nr:UDP-3-O-acyl-N-acetylglucosamine deacetylase [Oligoflexia bacterium]
MQHQQTLKSSVSLKGIGLHTGKIVNLVIHPARPNVGIHFVRTDLPGRPEIAALYRNVVCTRLATTLGRGDVKISTVEHLLAAFQGLGIDNAIVEVDGPELPILDGSSAPFVEAIDSIGVFGQAVVRPVLALRRKVELKVGEKWAVAEPSSRLEVHGSFEWDHPAIGYQEFYFREGQTDFREIAAARTFCMLRDVENMKKVGLALGGSLDNAVVMDESGVLNPGGLRYPNELARHKVLDALGDFKLAGIGMRAFIRMHRSGHELHGQLVEAIFKDPNNYEIIGGVREEVRTAPIAALAQRLVASVS